MASPIFLVQVPQFISESDMVKIRESISERIKDWHVLVAKTGVEDVTFTAFSEQGAIDVELESLQKMLLKK